jgi:ABC-2 type transport system ATP-binding protein
MKRRLNLAIGLVSRPRLLLLDEPTVGIDPQARIHILDVVRAVQSEGTAILYTTHYLEEAETLCDRVGIMDHGRILAEGTVAELRATVGEGTVVSLKGGFDKASFERAVSGNGQVRVLTAEDGVAMVSITGERRAAFDLLSSLMRAGLTIGDLAMQEASLQSVFIRLTGRELRD